MRIACIACGLMIGLIGCAQATYAPEKSTRLTADDYVYVVSETAAKLQDSDFLKQRGPDSPRAVINITKVENLTTDLIPEAEQWMFLINVRNAPAMSKLSQMKNFVFQVPPEQLARIRKKFPSAGSSAMTPTYIMGATFRSGTRSAKGASGFAEDRTEQYQLDYRITALPGGELVWSSTVEFKRAAKGNLID